MPPILTGWRLDKHFPIGIVLALVAQTVWITYWGTSKYDEVNSRISSLEKSDSGQESHENRIVILEQQFNYIRSDLADIKELLRRQLPIAEPQQ